MPEHAPQADRRTHGRELVVSGSPVQEEVYRRLMGDLLSAQAASANAPAFGTMPKETAERLQRLREEARQLHALMASPTSRNEGPLSKDELERIRFQKAIQSLIEEYDQGRGALEAEAIRGLRTLHTKAQQKLPQLVDPRLVGTGQASIIRDYIAQSEDALAHDGVLPSFPAFRAPPTGSVMRALEALHEDFVRRKEEIAAAERKPGYRLTIPLAAEMGEAPDIAALLRENEAEQEKVLAPHRTIAPLDKRAFEAEEILREAADAYKRKIDRTESALDEVGRHKLLDRVADYGYDVGLRPASERAAELRRDFSDEVIEGLRQEAGKDYHLNKHALPGLFHKGNAYNTSARLHAQKEHQHRMQEALEREIAKLKMLNYDKSYDQALADKAAIVAATQARAHTAQQDREHEMGVLSGQETAGRARQTVQSQLAAQLGLLAASHQQQAQNIIANMQSRYNEQKYAPELAAARASEVAGRLPPGASMQLQQAAGVRPHGPDMGNAIMAGINQLATVPGLGGGQQVRPMQAGVPGKAKGGRVHLADGGMPSWQQLGEEAQNTPYYHEIQQTLDGIKNLPPANSPFTDYAKNSAAAFLATANGGSSLGALGQALLKTEEDQRAARKEMVDRYKTQAEIQKSLLDQQHFMADYEHHRATTAQTKRRDEETARHNRATESADLLKATTTGAKVKVPSFRLGEETITPNVPYKYGDRDKKEYEALRNDLNTLNTNKGIYQNVIDFADKREKDIMAPWVKNLIPGYQEYSDLGVENLNNLTALVNTQLPKNSRFTGISKGFAEGQKPTARSSEAYKKEFAQKGLEAMAPNIAKSEALLRYGAAHQIPIEVMEAAYDQWLAQGKKVPLERIVKSIMEGGGFNDVDVEMDPAETVGHTLKVVPPTLELAAAEPEVPQLSLGERITALKAQRKREKKYAGGRL